MPGPYLNELTPKLKFKPCYTTTSQFVQCRLLTITASCLQKKKKQNTFKLIIFDVPSTDAE